MQTAAQNLETLTQAYWQISRCWNGKSNLVIETEAAINACTDVIFGINPARPLVKSMQMLQKEIIQGSGSPSRECKILTLPFKQA